MAWAMSLCSSSSKLNLFVMVLCDVTVISTLVATWSTTRNRWRLGRFTLEVYPYTC